MGETLGLLVLYLVLALSFCGVMLAWLIIMEYQDRADARKRRDAMYRSPEGRSGDCLPIHPDY